MFLNFGILFQNFVKIFVFVSKLVYNLGIFKQLFVFLNNFWTQIICEFWIYFQIRVLEVFLKIFMNSFNKFHHHVEVLQPHLAPYLFYLS